MHGVVLCKRHISSVGAVQNANFQCDMQKDFQLHQSKIMLDVRACYTNLIHTFPSPMYAMQVY